MSTLKKRSPEEERINTITHGIGCALSIVGLFILVYFSLRHGDGWHVLGSALFGVSLTLMYLCSTLYHAESDETRKQRYRLFDHISIYLLIAGTYSLVGVTLLRNTFGWTLFWIQWGLATAGVCFKLFFGTRFKVLSVLGYVAMGWLVAVALGPLVKILPSAAITWLILGGVCYTLGVPFYLLDRKKKYFHGVWHVFVMAGSGCHFFMGLFYIIPMTSS